MIRNSRKRQRSFFGSGLLLTLAMAFCRPSSAQLPAVVASQNPLPATRRVVKERLGIIVREVRRGLDEEREKWRRTLPPLAWLDWNATKVQEAFGVLFPTEAPRHVVDGIGKTVQSVLMGASLGTISFLLVPAALWAQALALQEQPDERQSIDGERDWAKTISNLRNKPFRALLVGLALGAMSAWAVMGLGILQGGYQLWQGFLNTPTAIQQGWVEGDVWDPYTQTWVSNYSLQEDQQYSLRSYQSQSVVDSKFYDVLGVPKLGATTKDIKLAHKKLALKWHPDKNPNNEQAAVKFIEITTAYLTLVDEEKRAVYDQHGEDNGTGGVAFNIPVFFAILFGSPLVEPYVGTMTISTFVARLMTWHHQYAIGRNGLWSVDLILVWHDQSDRARRKRQVEIASHLVEQLESYNNGHSRQFRDRCRKEAEEVSQTASFGDSFLVAVGEELQMQAQLHLSQWWDWSYHAAFHVYRHANFAAQSIYQAGKLICNLTQESKVGSQKQRGANPQSTQTPSISTEDIQEILPGIMDMAWAHIGKDIATTLSGACKKVFDDASSDEEIIRRAQALQILGEESVRRGLETSILGGKEKACMDVEAKTKARLEVAFQLAQTQEQNQILFPWIHLLTCILFLVSGCKFTTPKGSNQQSKGGLTVSTESGELFQNAKKDAKLTTIRE